MRTILYIIILLLTSCGRMEYQTFKITYDNGETEIVTAKHMTYDDGSFHKRTVDNGCVLISPENYRCGVRRVEYSSKP